MATLHVLSHSPFADDSLASCLRVLGTNDGILLSGDAVYALQAGSEANDRLSEATTLLYALEEDVAARNISIGEKAQLVDYSAFVELCCHYQKVNSWL